jgi:hypothetical protein
VRFLVKRQTIRFVPSTLAANGLIASTTASTFIATLGIKRTFGSRHRLRAHAGRGMLASGKSEARARDPTRTSVRVIRSRRTTVCGSNQDVSRLLPDLFRIAPTPRCHRKAKPAVAFALSMAPTTSAIECEAAEVWRGHRKPVSRASQASRAARWSSHLPLASPRNCPTAHYGSATTKCIHEPNQASRLSFRIRRIVPTYS